MTRIVSVWFPAWPIECRRRQAPKGAREAEPLALVAKGPHGLLVSAANEAALTAGVRVGAKIADARAAVPALAVRPAEPGRDAAALVALADWLGRYGPSRNVDGDDGLWIDITGAAHLLGGEARLCTDLKQRLHSFGLTARIGLADTAGAARALARHAASPSGITIAAAGTTKEALAGLPVAALDLQPDTLRLLVRLGLKRIGQLYGLPRAGLAARFRETAAGKRRGITDTAAVNVMLRLDQALGLVAEPQKPLRPPPEAECRLAFPEPLVTSDGLMAALERLASGLTDSLARQGLGARRFRLTLYRADGTVATAVIGTSTANRDPSHIRRLMSEKLAGIDAGFGIDIATLEASDLEPLSDVQTGLSPRGDHRGRDVTALIDRLANRLGPDRVLKLRRQASHVPERAESRAPAIAEATAPLPQEVHAAARMPPRPPLLLAPPEPISVIVELPEGAPQRFVWRRVPRRIVKSEGPERIAPEWWRHLGARQPGTRDYYRLEDTTGARYWVFREGLYGQSGEEAGDEGLPRWFLHGLFA